MDSFFADVGYALRGFRRSPAFTAVAVLTLALGVSATTAIYTVVDGVLLRALPFEAPSRLVSIDKMWATRGVFVRVRAENRSMAAVSAYGYPAQQIVTGPGEPMRLYGSSVSADLFSTLGVGAAVGRTFVPGEDETGNDHVVVLSHAFWQDHFGGDDRVLGKSIRIDGIDRTIVGVMPAAFRFPESNVAFWYPMILDPGDTSQGFWGEGGYLSIARLAPGVSLAQARSDMHAVAKHMLPEFPWRLPDTYGDSATATPLQDYLVSSMRPTLALMLGAVAVMLLVACVNIANLLLARTATRRREMAIRMSVGASTPRLVRQLLTESLTLAVIGGVLGVLGAAWGTRLLIAMLPADTPRLSEVHMDLRVLGVAAGLIIATGLAFGLAPAIRATQARPTRAPRHGTSWLVSAQVAMAVVLVAAAGLLGKSLWNLRLVDPGFATQQLLTATVPLPPVVRDTNTRAMLFQAAVLEHVREIPGVKFAATTSWLPLSDAYIRTAIQTEAHPVPQGRPAPEANFVYVSPDYFRVMGIPFHEGRAFTDADRDSTLHVAIIDETAARQLWPNQNPIGQRARHSWMNDWFTVVGVVSNVKHDSLSAASRPTIYWPTTQVFGHLSQLSLAMRISGDPGLVAQRLRSAVAEVDPQVPVTDIAPGTEIVSRSIARPRVTTLLLSIFAAAALLLGAIGIYGVMSHAVAQRSREIGIRMALGARTSSVLWMVVRQGLALVSLGVVAGLIGALGATRILRAMLFGVSPTDPLLFAAVPCLFAIVAIVASWAPARRAAGVNPVVAIRAD
jgi:putative ABC transport system permease protein